MEENQNPNPEELENNENPQDNPDDKKQEQNNPAPKQGDNTDDQLQFPDVFDPSEKQKGEDDEDEEPDADEKINAFQSEYKKNQQLNDFLDTEAGAVFKPYSSKIRAALQDKRAQGMSIEALVGAAIGANNLLKLGAKLSAEANNKARSASTGGQGYRAQELQPSTKLPDVSKMNDEQFAAHEQKIASGGYSGV